MPTVIATRDARSIVIGIMVVRACSTIDVVVVTDMKKRQVIVIRMAWIPVIDA